VHRTLPFLTPYPSPEPKQHPLYGEVGANFHFMEETLLRLFKIGLSGARKAGGSGTA